jgi:KUP system potassium uptake protein
MEAAYGLSISITMLMTTVLLTTYLYHRKMPVFFVVLLLLVYLTIEGGFLLANINKFFHGGWFAIMLAGGLFSIMYIWYNGRKIKNSFIEFTKIEEYYELLKEVNQDETITKYATNLVFLTKADKLSDIESKIIYSLFNKQPKRADVYWLVHVDIVDDPHTMDYRVTQLIDNLLIKIDFRIGFKVQPRVNLYFRQVINELRSKNEIDLLSRYKSLRKFNINGDFRFVVIDRIQNFDFDFPAHDQFIMNLYDIIKRFGISDIRALGLDTSTVTVEMVPLSVSNDVPEFQQGS